MDNNNSAIGSQKINFTRFKSRRGDHGSATTRSDNSLQLDDSSSHYYYSLSNQTSSSLPAVESMDLDIEGNNDDDDDELSISDLPTSCYNWLEADVHCKASLESIRKCLWETTQVYTPEKHLSLVEEEEKLHYQQQMFDEVDDVEICQVVSCEIGRCIKQFTTTATLSATSERTSTWMIRHRPFGLSPTKAISTPPGNFASDTSINSSVSKPSRRAFYGRRRSKVPDKGSTGTVPVAQVSIRKSNKKKSTTNHQRHAASVSSMVPPRSLLQFIWAVAELGNIIQNACHRVQQQLSVLRSKAENPLSEYEENLKRAQVQERRTGSIEPKQHQQHEVDSPLVVPTRDGIQEIDLEPLLRKVVTETTATSRPTMDDRDSNDECAEWEQVLDILVKMLACTKNVHDLVQFFRRPSWKLWKVGETAVQQLQSDKSFSSVAVLWMVWACLAPPASGPPPPCKPLVQPATNTPTCKENALHSQPRTSAVSTPRRRLVLTSDHEEERGEPAAIGGSVGFEPNENEYPFSTPEVSGSPSLQVDMSDGPKIINPPQLIVVNRGSTGLEQNEKHFLNDVHDSPPTSPKLVAVNKDSIVLEDDDKQFSDLDVSGCPPLPVNENGDPRQSNRPGFIAVDWSSTTAKQNEKQFSIASSPSLQVSDGLQKCIPPESVAVSMSDCDTEVNHHEGSPKLNITGSERETETVTNHEPCVSTAATKTEAMAKKQFRTEPCWTVDWMEHETTVFAEASHHVEEATRFVIPECDVPTRAELVAIVLSRPLPSLALRSSRRSDSMSSQPFMRGQEGGPVQQALTNSRTIQLPSVLYADMEQTPSSLPSNSSITYSEIRLPSQQTLASQRSDSSVIDAEIVTSHPERNSSSHDSDSVVFDAEIVNHIPSSQDSDSAVLETAISVHSEQSPLFKHSDTSERDDESASLSLKTPSSQHSNCAILEAETTSRSERTSSSEQAELDAEMDSRSEEALSQHANLGVQDVAMASPSKQRPFQHSDLAVLEVDLSSHMDRSPCQHSDSRGSIGDITTDVGIDDPFSFDDSIPYNSSIELVGVCHSYDKRDYVENAEAATSERLPFEFCASQKRRNLNWEQFETAFAIDTDSLRAAVVASQLSYEDPHDPRNTSKPPAGDETLQPSRERILPFADQNEGLTVDGSMELDAEHSNVDTYNSQHERRNDVPTRRYQAEEECVAVEGSMELHSESSFVGTGKSQLERRHYVPTTGDQTDVSAQGDQPEENDVAVEDFMELHPECSYVGTGNSQLKRRNDVPSSGDQTNVMESITTCVATSEVTVIGDLDTVVGSSPRQLLESSSDVLSCDDTGEEKSSEKTTFTQKQTYPEAPEGDHGLDSIGDLVLPLMSSVQSFNESTKSMVNSLIDSGQRANGTVDTVEYPTEHVDTLLTLDTQRSDLHKVELIDSGQRENGTVDTVEYPTEHVDNPLTLDTQRSEVEMKCASIRQRLRQRRPMQGKAKEVVVLPSKVFDLSVSSMLPTISSVLPVTRLAPSVEEVAAPDARSPSGGFSHDEKLHLPRNDAADSCVQSPTDDLILNVPKGTSMLVMNRELDNCALDSCPCPPNGALDATESLQIDLGSCRPLQLNGSVEANSKLQQSMHTQENIEDDVCNELQPPTCTVEVEQKANGSLDSCFRPQETIKQASSLQNDPMVQARRRRHYSKQEPLHRDSYASSPVATTDLPPPLAQTGSVKRPPKQRIKNSPRSKEASLPEVTMDSLSCLGQPSADKRLSRPGSKTPHNGSKLASPVSSRLRERKPCSTGPVNDMRTLNFESDFDSDAASRDSGAVGKTRRLSRSHSKSIVELVGTVAVSKMASSEVVSHSDSLNAQGVWDPADSRPLGTLATSKVSSAGKRRYGDCHRERSDKKSRRAGCNLESGELDYKVIVSDYLYRFQATLPVAFGYSLSDAQNAIAETLALHDKVVDNVVDEEYNEELRLQKQSFRILQQRADQERLESLRFAEETALRQRELDYYSRKETVDQQEAEIERLCNQPIRFVSDELWEKACTARCCFGNTCTLCSNGGRKPSEPLNSTSRPIIPAPRFQPSRVNDLWDSSCDEPADKKSRSGRSRRSGGKVKQALLMLNEMRQTLNFIESNNDRVRKLKANRGR